MAWAYDSAEFEYDDWAPYAVFESDDVLVVRSEGDYFFALRVDAVHDVWQPIPQESSSLEDFERLRVVALKLTTVISHYRDFLTPGQKTDTVQGSFASNGTPFPGYRPLQIGEDPGTSESRRAHRLIDRELQEIGDFDSLWGLMQEMVPVLLALKERVAGENPPTRSCGDVDR